jgi:hypothetical protein
MSDASSDDPQPPGAPARDPPGDPLGRRAKPQPAATAETRAAHAAREARRAAALRENLKRRKAQARARDDQGE